MRRWCLARGTPPIWWSCAEAHPLVEHPPVELVETPAALVEPVETPAERPLVELVETPAERPLVELVETSPAAGPLVRWSSSSRPPPPLVRRSAGPLVELVETSPAAASAHPLSRSSQPRSAASTRAIPSRFESPSRRIRSA